MFIEGDLRNKPGLRGELKAWRSLQKFFKERESFGFLHYPIFNKKFKGMREIDILIFDKFYGACVFEIKGLKIDQIESIQGHVWNYKVYDNSYSSKGTPLQQAIKQIDILCNKIEEDPLLYRSFDKRVFIVLPYIKKKEWIEKEFGELANNLPILFEDDLMNKQQIANTLNSFLFKSNKELDDQRWGLIKRIFEIKKRNYKETHSFFSRLYILSSEKEFIFYKEEIEKLLGRGIKVYLLIDFVLSKEVKMHYKEFLSVLQLNIVESSGTKLRLKNAVIIDDGKVPENLDSNISIEKIIKSNFPDFNLEQYKIIHAPVDSHMMVTAGAGTGKTHVMIDRILFLILTMDVKLKDVIMVTFTNEAKNEMKERLQKRLITLYRVTKLVKFLNIAEDVKSLNIDTIHLFAKSILTSLAHEIGYGSNVKVRNFVKEKKDIIQNLADEFIEKNTDISINEFRMPDYMIVNLIYSFWGKMESSGLTDKEIRNLDWGEVTDSRSIPLQRLLKFVFSEAEERLNQVKREENAISMSDFITKIKQFTNNEQIMKQIESNKYLFIDEFQDSDNVQIDMISSVANFLNYKLFVVGDVKQSIYRFRGADYKAFTQLKSTITENFIEEKIRHNYRSDNKLLGDLHAIFNVWSMHDLLIYESDDRLESKIDVDESFRGLKIHDYDNSEKHKQTTVNLIKSARVNAASLKKDENKKIALIVRTNGEAQKIKTWCDEASIPTTQNLDGTFYISDAVKDFKSLIEGLLYSNQANYVLNALRTPYFRIEVLMKNLLIFDGENYEIINYIKRDISPDFFDYVNELKTLPVMAVIQKIIYEKGIFNIVESKSYFEKRIKSEKIEDYLKKYEQNLYHLINIIQKQFDMMNSSLFDIQQWLDVQVKTTRHENEPSINSISDAVEITTVHRSKGLEYYAVIIPYTDFNYQRQQKKTNFYLEQDPQQDTSRKAGWSINNIQKNNLFESLSEYEEAEVHKEETRLLYVALTRAIARVDVLLPAREIQNSWSDLIKIIDRR